MAFDPADCSTRREFRLHEFPGQQLRQNDPNLDALTDRDFMRQVKGASPRREIVQLAFLFRTRTLFPLDSRDMDRHRVVDTFLAPLLPAHAIILNLNTGTGNERTTAGISVSCLTRNLPGSGTFCNIRMPAAAESSGRIDRLSDEK
jgi:hypothetical protein